MVELAGIGKSYRLKLSKVLEQNFAVITPNLVSKTLSISTQESGRLLARWCKNGWIYRIKRGTYVPIPINSTSSDVILEEPFVVVESIYGPGYIAGFTAIKHWDFSEQIFETITFFTCQKVKNRNPCHGGIKFKIKTIANYKMFGLKNLWFGNIKVKVSDPTKTMIDLLDDPKLVGGISVICDFFSEYIESEYYNFDLLIQYAHKMRNRTIFKRLGLILETKFNVTDKSLDVLLKNISVGLSEFDPLIPSNDVIHKWRLKVPAYWKKEYDSKK
ncbi:hypothetical protein MNBD_BACTEROID06-303 [hydrothermal vent metagenome]|uniref:AbiEi antitoxin C-terminal domain-containing protein n=1 Tax=hydrothermal vent metagenome TaxID=652676 RepID=A0A3B0UK16_9ZZZZ